MQFGEKVQVKIQFSTCFVSTACITDVWYLRQSEAGFLIKTQHRQKEQCPGTE